MQEVESRRVELLSGGRFEIRFWPRTLMRSGRSPRGSGSAPKPAGAPQPRSGYVSPRPRPAPRNLDALSSAPRALRRRSPPLATRPRWRILGRSRCATASTTTGSPP